MRKDSAALKDVLFKAIYDATEVKIPTSFVILNYKIEVDSPTNGLVAPSIEDVVTKADKWLTGITNFVSDASTSFGNFVENSKQTIDECMRKFLTDQTLYFYYVDELTMRPVVLQSRHGYKYPFEITKPSEKIRSMLPLLKATLAGAKLLNTAGGIARLFGYPIPCVKSSIFDGAKASLDKFKDASSVASFGVVQSGVDSEEIKSKLRGSDLRELTLFFNEYDQEGVFANLFRVCDLTDGSTCWTTETGKEWLGMSRDDQLKVSTTDPKKWGHYKIALFGEESMSPVGARKSPVDSTATVNSSVYEHASDQKSESYLISATDSATAKSKELSSFPLTNRNAETEESTPNKGQVPPPVIQTNGSLVTAPAYVPIITPTHFNNISLETWLKEEIRPREQGKVQEYFQALTGQGGFDDFYDLCHEYMEGSVGLDTLTDLGIDDKGGLRMISALESRVNLGHLEYEKAHEKAHRELEENLRKLEASVPHVVASLPIQPKRKDFSFENAADRFGNLASDMLRSPRSGSSSGKSVYWEEQNPASNQRLVTTRNGGIHTSIDSGKSRSRPSTPQRPQSPVHSGRGTRPNQISMASEPGQQHDGEGKVKSSCVILLISISSPLKVRSLVVLLIFVYEVLIRIVLC